MVGLAQAVRGTGVPRPPDGPSDEQFGVTVHAPGSNGDKSVFSVRQLL